MFESIKEIVITLLIAGALALIAYLLRAKKQKLLTLITKLVQEAENKIKGSKMGEEKKARVITQLQETGVKVTDGVSKAIDAVVAYLNEKSLWLKTEAVDAAKETADKAVGGADETDSEDGIDG
jgi:hypothetical protein